MTMKAFLRLHFYFYLFLGVLCGCHSFEPITQSHPGQLTFNYPKPICTPVFLTPYYPYNQAFEYVATRPTLEYAKGSWPQERMWRDLQKIAQTQIDVVICVINLDLLTDSLQTKQLQTFSKVCQEFPKLKFCLMLEQSNCQATTPDLLSHSLEVLFRLNIFNESAYYQASLTHNIQRQKPLLLLSPSLSSIRLRHPALHIIKTNHTNQWNLLPPCSVSSTDALVSYSKDKTQAAIFPALFQDNQWVVPSDSQAKRLGRGFQEALQNFSHFIIIMSWNNYQDGQFIEANLLFQDLLQRRAKIEIETIKNEFPSQTIPKREP